MQTISVSGGGGFDTAAEDTHAVQDTHAVPDIRVVRRHVDGLYRFVRVLGADRELASDLVQEAFVVAWQKGKQDLPQRALAAFLRRTIRYLWLHHRRSERRAAAAMVTASEELWQRECSDEGDELIAATRACVLQLNGRAATAVQLAYGDGRDREGIAEALGLTPNGVKTLLARTRRWLEQCIRRQMP